MDDQNSERARIQDIEPGRFRTDIEAALRGYTDGLRKQIEGGIADTARQLVEATQRVQQSGLQHLGLPTEDCEWLMWSLHNALFGSPANPTPMSMVIRDRESTTEFDVVLRAVWACCRLSDDQGEVSVHELAALASVSTEIVRRARRHGALGDSRDGPVSSRAARKWLEERSKRAPSDDHGTAEGPRLAVISPAVLADAVTTDIRTRLDDILVRLDGTGGGTPPRIGDEAEFVVEWAKGWGDVDALYADGCCDDLIQAFFSSPGKFVRSLPSDLALDDGSEDELSELAARLETVLSASWARIAIEEGWDLSPIHLAAFAGVSAEIVRRARRDDLLPGNSGDPIPAQAARKWLRGRGAKL